MIKEQDPGNLTIDEMIDCLSNPSSNHCSLAELDRVIDDVIDGNPEWFRRITEIVEKNRGVQK